MYQGLLSRKLHLFDYTIKSEDQRLRNFEDVWNQFEIAVNKDESEVQVKGTLLSYENLAKALQTFAKYCIRKVRNALKIECIARPRRRITIYLYDKFV